MFSKLLGKMELSSTMPITGVTLYDNGYAVFEREAMVRGSGQMDLYFPKSLIKDVLETLQFAGDAGPSVGNIAYEATKPTANIEFDESSPFVQLLQSLVGCKVDLDMKNSAKAESGRIVGIERDVPGEDVKASVVPHVSLYKSGGRLKVIPINVINEVVLLEERTKQDVAFSLDLTKNENRDDMQKLSVFYSNIDSPKKLVARYGFKVNEWKSSYRMTYSLDNPQSLMLHGLAIIENSLWEDWNDVRVTLVVGTPAIQNTSSEMKDEGLWRLVVRSLDGSTVTIRANPKDSVLAVKGKIGKKKGVNPFSFKLIFCGKTVEDGRQLSDYTITDGSQLHMSKVESGGIRSSGTPQQVSYTLGLKLAQMNVMTVSNFQLNL